MTITAPHPRPPVPQPVRAPRRSARRVVALVLGLFLLIGAAGSLATAGVLSWFDDDRRDGDYLTTDETSLDTGGHALAVEEVDLNGLSGDWILGRARLRATSADPDTSVFIGIARADDAKAYLRGVAYTTVEDVDDQETTNTDHIGGAPASTPADADIWIAQTSGPGTQSVTWTPRNGNWTAVIMNADATSGVAVQADVGATVPVFGWVTCALWITGATLGLAGLALVGGGLLSRRRS
ncbi:hypothetical protein SFC88_01125 [Nocardioides sp. HM23]|uniref:hypothetical protein n=1 Tax=Nocardioides bizhenqiangii TaxID=3095076 RepID=UPI002ACA35DB|nr:hypothetical protein [Nocardioides sp. HM23]MDZ5619404.1 hypothetical protein [Nocardioides sp. HM23]